MTVRVIGARPVAADEDVLPGLAVVDAAGTIEVIDESTAAAAMGVKPYGIAMTDDAGGVAQVVVEGEVNALAGAEVMTGDIVVVQEGTGRLVPLDGTLVGTLTEGTVIWYVGRALGPASGDGVQFRCFVRPALFTVPTAPTEGGG